MARYRLSRLAAADLAGILATSQRQWGSSGRQRYAALLAAAMRRIAAEPVGPATRDRADLRPGIRSLHVRYARADDPNARVRRPVHVLFYRSTEPEIIEIVRVLHERMEPRRHLRDVPEDR
jgi:toxin ParE1/3/4